MDSKSDKYGEEYGRFDFDLEGYIAGLKWSPQATEHEKALVVGNLRGMFAVIRERHNNFVRAAKDLATGFAAVDAELTAQTAERARTLPYGYAICKRGPYGERSIGWRPIGEEKQRAMLSTVQSETPMPDPTTPADIQKRISELRAEIHRLTWKIVGNPSQGVTVRAAGSPLIPTCSCGYPHQSCLGNRTDCIAKVNR